MKKLLKILAWIFGLFGLIAIGFFSFIHIGGIPSYETQKVEFKVMPTPEKLVRGEMLVSTLCAGCHMNFESGVLSGKLMTDAPKEFGAVYAPNITQNKEYGIGEWTDGEIIFLLRTGIKRDGQYSPPWMAKLPHLSDYDAESILAFLRSDNKLVNDAPIPDQPCEPSFLAKFLSRVEFFPFDYPDHQIPQPDTNNAVEWGKYLVFNFECYSCHSADFKTNNYLEPEQSVGYLGGGNKPLNLDGKVMLTQNITSHKEFGIGSMSEKDFVQLLKYGIKKGEESMRYPMLPYIRLSNSEARAIYAYLLTTPALENNIPRSVID